MRIESVLTSQYLEPLARFHELLSVSLRELSMPLTAPVEWDCHILDVERGVPLLQSSTAKVNLAPAGSDIASIIGELSTKNRPAAFSEKLRALNAKLGGGLFSPVQITSWLFHPVPLPNVDSGLLYLVGWKVLARYLQPVVLGFSSWTHGERWLRPYCPTCGAPPAMAQLVGVDAGRLRFLACGHCHCRWKFARTSCPFCFSDGNGRLATLAVEGHEQLRVDYCEECAGYLKTYNGSGDEGWMLSDWNSLHLDVLALDHGLQRLARSLYQISVPRHDVQPLTR